MTRPLNRNRRTNVLYSLDLGDLALCANADSVLHLATQPTSDFADNGGNWPTTLTREHLQLGVAPPDVISASFESPRIQTVGCQFQHVKELAKLDKQQQVV